MVKRKERWEGEKREGQGTKAGPTGLIAINVLVSVDFFAVLNIERDQISALRD